MWLVTCHNDETAIEEINARFQRIFELLERSGTAIGLPSVRLVHGYGGDLWEMRVRHRTGAYRLFFAVRGEVIAVATGERKTDEDFRPAVYKRAKEKVDAFLATIVAPDNTGGG
jgi:hypothetical protein